MKCCHEWMGRLFVIARGAATKDLSSTRDTKQDLDNYDERRPATLQWRLTNSVFTHVL